MRLVRVSLIAGFLGACASPAADLRSANSEQASLESAHSLSAPHSQDYPGFSRDEPGGPDGNDSELIRDPRVLWCVSGGAPVVGLPVIDQQNRTYVATSDGYLHAFERDGRYRFSYTVKGTPLGSVSLRQSDGLVLMGTTNKLIYAISQRGTLDWSFSTITPVWSGLFALNAHAVVFIGLDKRLYAVSNSGHALYRVSAPGTPVGGPVVDVNDVVWVALADGVARFQAAFKLERFPMSSSVSQLVTWKTGAVALASGKAFWLKSGDAPHELGNAQYLASGGGRLLLLSDDRLSIYDEPHGPARELTLELGELGGAPVLSANAVWVPGADGRMRIVDLDHGAIDEIAVGTQGLRTPVVSGTGDYAIFTDTMGRFCAYDPAVPIKFEKH